MKTTCNWTKSVPPTLAPILGAGALPSISVSLPAQAAAWYRKKPAALGNPIAQNNLTWLNLEISAKKWPTLNRDLVGEHQSLTTNEAAAINQQIPGAQQFSATIATDTPTLETAPQNSLLQRRPPRPRVSRPEKTKTQTLKARAICRTIREMASLSFQVPCLPHITTRSCYAHPKTHQIPRSWSRSKIAPTPTACCI